MAFKKPGNRQQDNNGAIPPVSLEEQVLGARHGKGDDESALSKALASRKFLATVAGIAVSVAVFAIVMAIASATQTADLKNKVETQSARAIVATREIAEGEKLTSDNVAVTSVSPSGLPDNAITSIDGNPTASHAISPKTVVTQNDTAEGVESSLAKKVAPGKVAQTISLAVAQGMTRTLTSADHVNVYLEGEDGVIAQNVRVLAVTSPKSSDDAADKTVTIELSPSEAQRVSEKSGEVWLVTLPAQEG